MLIMFLNVLENLIRKEKLLPHLKNGAKKVIVSAPCKNADKTIVFGVNEKNIKKNDKIISKFCILHYQLPCACNKCFK